MALRSGKDGEKEEKLVQQEKQKQDEPHPPRELLLESSSYGPGPPTPPAPTCAASCPFPAAAPPPARHGHLGFGPSSSREGRGAPPAPAARPPLAPLLTTAGPNSCRGPVAQNRGRTARPPRPGPETAGSRREGTCQPCPGSPAGSGQLLPRQTRRAPGTSTWGLRHQRRAAPPVRRVTSSPALPARGGSRHGSGWRPRSRPVVSAFHGHTLSVGLGGAGTALYGACAPPGCCLLRTALARCPSVLSVITTSPLSHPVTPN